jgi:peptidoglycan lytic transglycosylase D
VQFVVLPARGWMRLLKCMDWKSLSIPGGLILALALAGCGPSQSKTAAKLKPQALAPAVQAPPAAPAAAEKKAELSTAKQQRIQQLIEEVNAAYAAGDVDYRQGRLPEAKTQFDRAVDLMLSSGIDIKSTPELDAEYERIVDKVSNLEMEALKQGNGFVSNVEPSPADVANDITFKVDPNLMAKAQADLATTKSDLPLVVNQYVAGFINFFAYTEKGHNTLLHAFERAGMYKGMIARILAEEGVPQDLSYLAVAESGFQPRAVNWRSGAGGMWQFMPRGKYGLTRNRYVDERFDPEESTLAYARYMKFLHDQLGDWYLAMAAYDWGAGNVQRAVAKTGYADFWQLYERHELPAETQNYVPEILAAIIIANHPKQYGFDDITLDPPVLTDTVTINYSVNLRLVSDLVGAPVTELEALNPSLLRTVTPPDTSFDLHLPAGTATLFNQLIAQIPEDKRDTWRYHEVKGGDTIASVAREYHVSEASLASANQMHESDSLADVTGLVVPVRVEDASFVGGRVYRVREGDTLGAIARRFGVSVNELRVWNGIRGSIIRAGHPLYVAAPERARVRSDSHRRASTTAAERHKEDRTPASARVYTVRRGDTLDSIAGRFGVLIGDLRRWNGIHGSEIRAGRHLYVADPARTRGRGDIALRKDTGARSADPPPASRRDGAAAGK